MAFSSETNGNLRSNDLWIFAYGSLMWRPGFPFAETQRARLDGWHRRFCIVSRYYRGTAEHPGLLLGLDRGGSCEGIAFRVAAEKAREVLRYLRVREQISGVYREARLNIEVHATPALRPTAVVFLAEPAHPSYVRFRLPVWQQARIITHARGSTGSNLDYLANTLGEIARLNIRERELERVLSSIGRVRLFPGNGAARPGLGGPKRAIPGWPLGVRYRLSDVKRFGHRSRMG